MRKIIQYPKLFFVLATTLLMSCMVGCSEENIQDVTPEISANDAVPRVTMYTPTTGGKGTILTLYGTHFGTDLNNVRVTVNGVDAEVTGAFGNIATAEVARNSGSGAVKVYVKKGEEEVEMTYGTLFEYSTSPIVSTYFGFKIDDKSGKKYGNLQEARLWKPMAIKFDNEGSLYIIQDEDPDVAMVKNGQVSLFLKGSSTDGGLVNRMRDLSFSLNYDKFYIANDYNGKGKSHIASIPWESTGYNAESMTALVDKDNSNIDAGMTNVAVHPKNGKIYSVKHNPGEIYVYDEEQKKMLTTNVILPYPEGSDKKIESHCMLFSKDGTTVYVSSQRTHVIFKGKYDLDTQTFSDFQIWVGKYGEAGWAEGKGSAAKLNEPYQMDLDQDGNLYVAVFKAHRIAKITPDGYMTRYAGTGTSGTADGTLEQAQFNHPAGIQFGPDGVLYVAEYWNHAIRKIECE